MKLRPVDALPPFLCTPPLDGQNLDCNEPRFGKEIRNCHGMQRAH
jgi:hypothetical protein